MKIAVDEMPKKPEECLLYVCLTKTSLPYCGLVGSLNHRCFLEYEQECPNFIKCICSYSKED